MSRRAVLELSPYYLENFYKISVKLISLLVLTISMSGCPSSNGVKQSSSTPAGTTSVTNSLPTPLPKTAAPGEISKAVFSQQPVGTLATLLATGANINENIGTTTKPITPLLISIINTDNVTAKYLLANGAQYKYFSEGFTLGALATFQGMDPSVTSILNNWGVSTLSFQLPMPDSNTN